MLCVIRNLLQQCQKLQYSLKFLICLVFYVRFLTFFFFKESTQFNPQEVEVAGCKGKYGLGNRSETLKKEELNIQYLQNQEEMPRYQVANKRKPKKKKRTQLHKSSHYHWRKKIEYSVRKEKMGKLLTNEYNHSVSDQNTLQISLIKDQPLEKEDHLNSNDYYHSQFSERDHDRKDEIYETYDFIDFPLNHYYQTPEYPSICLEPSHPTSTCQWQRSVHAKGNGFQVNLRKCNCHSITSSQTQKLQRREQVQEDDYGANSNTEDLVHKPQKRAKVDYAKECSKEFKNHYKDTVSEAHDQLTPTDGKGYLLEKTYAYQVRDSKSRTQSQVSSFKRSENLKLEFTDFLEEISSDSEWFGETLSINKEEKEKSVVTCESTPEGGSLDTDEVITYNQQIRSSQPTLYSKWKHFGEEKFSEHQLGKPSKRSKYEQRCLWLEDENNSMRTKNSNSKKEEKLAPKYMFYQGNFHKSSSSDVLDDSTRKKSKFSDNTFDQKINYRPFYVPTASSQCVNAFYSRCFPQRREFLQKSEYNQDVRMFKRHANSTDFMPTLDNYPIRRNSQEHIDCGSYNLGKNYTSSIYFKMF